MVKTFMIRYAPIISIAILMLAMGLFNTLVPLRLEALNYSEFAIGFVGSIYYLGMFIGSMSVLKFLDSVGPSKTFILSTLILSFVTIMPGFDDDLILWIVTRFIAGFSLAWVYVVVESWVLRVSNRNNRGKNLAIYMIVLYLGQSGGQLFLGITDILTIVPFILASVLGLIAIGPIISVKDAMPSIKIPNALGFFNLYKISPTGILGCVLSGLLLGSIYSLLPLYFKETGYDITSVATLMSLVIAGGVVMQYPFGLLADCMDRRIVLIILCAAGIVVSGLMIAIDYFTAQHEILAFVLVFIFGGITFSIYPTSLNHTCDYVDSNYVVEVTQGMMLAYGAGSSLGPVSISLTMKYFGPDGIFYSFIFSLIVMIIFMSIRMIASNKSVGVGGEYIGSPPHVEFDNNTQSK